jgi:hypothetical protein
MNKSTFDQAAKLYGEKKNWEDAARYFHISDFEKNDSLSNKNEAQITKERVVNFLTDARNVSTESIKTKLAKKMLEVVESYINEEIESIENSIATL